jgi:hypothetical protein
VATGISKDELTRYYSPPVDDIPLIDTAEVSQDIKNDYIDYSVLKENQNCISSYQPYTEGSESQDDLTSWTRDLSEYDRERAKHEAMQLFKKWKQV